MGRPIRRNGPFALVQRIAVRIGQENPSAVGTIQYEMPARLAHDVPPSRNGVGTIDKVGRKGEVALANQCTDEWRHVMTGGCSKRSANKAAGESKPEAYPLGYVEDFDDPRTQLEAFFSSLYSRIWPLPNTTNFVLVNSSSPIGPRAWMRVVLMPISAPSPN